MNFLSKFFSTKSGEEEVSNNEQTALERDVIDTSSEEAKPERPISPSPAGAPHDDPAFREAMQHSYSPPFVDGGYADGSMMDEFEANAGHPLADGETVAAEAEVIEAMRTVYDPEIPVNIYDLGLIYECNIEENGNVKIEMSLTAPGCPVAGEIPGMVADAVAGAEGVGEVNVKLVWEPMWTPERMSEDAKLALGMM